MIKQPSLMYHSRQIALLETVEKTKLKGGIELYVELDEGSKKEPEMLGVGFSWKAKLKATEAYPEPEDALNIYKTETENFIGNILVPLLKKEAKRDGSYFIPNSTNNWKDTSVSFPTVESASFKKMLGAKGLQIRVPVQVHQDQDPIKLEDWVVYFEEILDSLIKHKIFKPGKDDPWEKK